MSSSYEVLSPWAEVDSITARGISPRLIDMENMKIGLFYNGKRAAQPIQNVIEKRLKERITSLYFTRFERVPNISVAETEDFTAFEEWVKEVDAVILAVGD